MHAHLLCDWTTVRGTSATSPVAQEGWLDVTDYHDCVFWLDCREVTGTVVLRIQTSPSVNTSDFLNVLQTTLVAAPGPIALTALASSAFTPIAQWIRWQLFSTSGTWDATFRVWVSANSPGR